MQLSNTTVQVDNWSAYTAAQLTPLIQWADRGMATTDPLNKNVPGEMENGDRVVVTPYDIYWLDIVRRGGLLSGIWPIVDSAGGPTFQYTPSGNDWEPNELLPGATGSNAAVYDTGQGLNVLATGGTDGSCTPGHGTFVINNTDICGVADSGVKVRLQTSNSGSDHSYSFSGTLYQAGTNHDQVMVDSYGDSAKVNFTLTYHFHDYTDTSDYDYGSGNGTAIQRVRTDLTLTPTAPIHLGTLVVAGNSDPGNAPYPYRAVNYSDTTRDVYYPNGSGCSPSPIPSGGLGTLCEGSPYPSNWISQPNTLPATLAEGNFVTEQQSTTVGDTADRSLTAMLPLTTAYRLPERIDHIWNAGLGVSSLDVDYFNQEDVFVPRGGSIPLGFDLQTVPHP